jgi:putative Ca2+/H+ antiporter (TMEM165/GDT1 family)
VWLAVVAALSLVSALGVLVGRAMGQWLPVTAIRYVSATLFFAAGAWILLRP